MGFKNRHHYLKYEAPRKNDEDYIEAKRRARQRRYQKRREEELTEFKEHYKKNKAYHKRKNKEYNVRNGDKWKKRRAEISEAWTMDHCKPGMVLGTFESLGASITVTEPIPFSQLCALIESLGYDIKDVTYPPFINRLKYFNKKRTP